MHFCIFVIALFKCCGRKAAEAEEKPRVKKSTVKGGRIGREQHQEEEKRDKTNTKKERKKKKKRGQRRRSAEASRRGRGIRNTKRRGEAKKEKEWTGRG